MKKRLLALLLAAATMTGVLAGCGAKDAPAQGGAADAGNAEKPVELKFWGDWTGEGEDWMNAMIDAFETENPGITIEYVPQPEILDKLVTSIAGGTTPDILFWDRYLTSTYARKGFLYDITEMAKTDNVNLDVMVPGGLEEMTIDGKLYGLPIIVDTRGYVYNVKDFKDAGLEAPKSWDDFLKAADAISAKTGKPFMATGELLGLFASLMQAGGYPLDDAGNLKYDTPQALSVLEFYKTMLDKNQLLVMEKDMVPTFAQGNVSVAPMISAEVANLKQFVGADMEYAFIEPPVGPNGEKGAMLGGYGLAIPAKSKNAEAAFKFVSWWAANAENAKIFCDLSGELPANVELLKSEEYAGNEQMKPFVDALMYARPRPTVAWWDDVEKKVIKPTLEMFLEGKLSPQEALTKIDAEGNALIATLG